MCHQYASRGAECMAGYGTGVSENRYPGRDFKQLGTALLRL